MITIPILKKRISLSVWLRLLAFLGLLLAGLALVRYSSLGELLTEDNLMAFLTRLRGVWWAPMALVGLYTLLAVLGLPPGPLLVGGALFGPFYGAIYNITGLCLGAAGGYLVAKLLGRDFVIQITGDRLRRAEDIFESHGFWPLVQSRFLPLPFAVINFGAALAGVRPSLFLTASIAGLIPSTLIHTYFIANLLVSGGRERAILLGLYVATFIIFNILISALWLKGKDRKKLLNFGWLTTFLRQMIQRLDSRLRRKLGIFEYWDHPHCMFRVQVARADRKLIIPGGEVAAGTKIVELHIWNDHIPTIATDGKSVARSVKGFRMFKHSLTELAIQVKQDPRMSGVQAVGGLMPLFTVGDSYPAEKMLTRLGFAVHPHHGDGRFFSLLGKQMHGWMIMWAFNPVTLKNRDLFGLRWADCWMSIDDLIQTHTKQNSATNRL